MTQKASRKETMACRIAVERTNEHFCAHTVYSGGPAFGAGDSVRVNGPVITAETGDRFIERRTAHVRRAGPIRRTLVKLIAILEISGLYEVSFSGRRKP